MYLCYYSFCHPINALLPREVQWVYEDSFLSVCSIDIPHAPLVSRWHWLVLFGLAIVTGLLLIAPVCYRI